MQSAWGQSVAVQGVGTGCVLIRRDVVERIPFTRRGVHGFDYYFAVDCVKAGITQRMDTSILCGHIDPDNACIWWPTAEGYRTEVLSGV